MVTIRQLRRPDVLVPAEAEGAEHCGVTSIRNFVSLHICLKELHLPHPIPHIDLGATQDTPAEAALCTEQYQELC